MSFFGFVVWLTYSASMWCINVKIEHCLLPLPFELEFFSCDGFWLWIVEALQEITSTMGAKYWKFNGDSCEIEMIGVTAEPPVDSEKSIECECNNTVCHVVKLYSSLTLLLDAFTFHYLCIHHDSGWYFNSFTRKKRKENKIIELYLI